MYQHFSGCPLTPRKKTDGPAPTSSAEQTEISNKRLMFIALLIILSSHGCRPAVEAGYKPLPENPGWQDTMSGERDRILAEGARNFVIEHGGFWRRAFPQDIAPLGNMRIAERILAQHNDTSCEPPVILFASHENSSERDGILRIDWVNTNRETCRVLIVALSGNGDEYRIVWNLSLDYKELEFMSGRGFRTRLVTELERGHGNEIEITWNEAQHREEDFPYPQFGTSKVGVAIEDRNRCTSNFVTIETYSLRATSPPDPKPQDDSGENGIGDGSAGRSSR